MTLSAASAPDPAACSAVSGLFVAASVADAATATQCYSGFSDVSPMRRWRAGGIGSAFPRFWRSYVDAHVPIRMHDPAVNPATLVVPIVLPDVTTTVGAGATSPRIILA